MKKIAIRPIGENVLIVPDKTEEKTSAGIYIPDTSKGTQQTGKVLAVGDDAPAILIGQRAVFRKFVGEEIESDGEKYIIVDQKQILAIIG